MHLDEINRITVPTIKAFPYGKVFFDTDNEEKPNIWQEATSINRDEAIEFQKVNDITPKPENLM